MEKIIISEKFSMPVEELFAFLENHDNLGQIFAPMQVKTLHNGSPEVFGVGSVRQLSLGPVLPFEETVTAYTKNERIEYKITKGSPMKNHHGMMLFTAEGNGSSLYYTIEFDSDIPGLAFLVKQVLEAGIRKGLKALKNK